MDENIAVLQKMAEKVAQEICPHHFDKAQRDDIKNSLIEFAKAIIDSLKRKEVSQHMFYVDPVDEEKEEATEETPAEETAE